MAKNILRLRLNGLLNRLEHDIQDGLNRAESTDDITMHNYLIGRVNGLDYATRYLQSILDDEPDKLSE